MKRLTKADVAALKLAASRAEREWYSSQLNYGVIAKTDDGVIPAETAARRRDALQRRRNALAKAVAKLDGLWRPEDGGEG